MTTMKQIIIAIALVGLAYSCSKEEPIKPEISKEVTPEENQTPKKEDAKGEENPKDEDAPKDQGDDKNDNQPKPEGKPADDNKPNEQPPSDEKINPNDSQANRPENHYIGSRMQVKWKVPEDTYMKHIDLDPLYIHNDAQQLSSKLLGSLVQFYSSSPESDSFYTLTDEEVNEIEILDAKYRDGAIVFKTKYNGIVSHNEHRLPFSTIDYYSRKVKVRSGNGWYLFGASQRENLGLYLSDFIDYDTDKYAAYPISAYAQSNNMLTVQFQLVDSKTEKDLAIVEKTITGFRPLSNLSNDLEAFSTYDLVKYLQKIKGVKDMDMQSLKERLGRSISNWIKNVEFYYTDGNFPLSWETMNVDGGTTSVLSGRDGSKAKMHLYFKDPRFDLVSVERQDRRLVIKIRLTFVNDEAVENVTYTLSAPIY